MPEHQTSEYNPVIAGFSWEEGPLDITLNDAKKAYGQLPSKYGFVSAEKRRASNKTLNLDIGSLIRELLSDKTRSLKREVCDFFREWHRDFKSEFRVNTAPFFNINRPSLVEKVLRGNRAALLHSAGLDIKKTLQDSGLIRRDVLNSISPDHLLSKTTEILTRKIRAGGRPAGAPAREVLSTLNCYGAVKGVMQYSRDGSSLPTGDDAACFADEIGKALLAFHGVHPLSGVEPVSTVTGRGVEFEYAPRDYSYLELGKRTGDCTADKRNFQADRTIENIFWTVFSWILDRNYQILKVFLEGEFVMKVHLLPIYVTGDQGYISFGGTASAISDYMFLAVDAIETTVAFREDISPGGKGPKAEVFSKTMDFIKDLADAMNIEAIYAEKFSNTPWIRDIFASYPEIFFHVDHLVKIDQLEDVFSLADELSAGAGYKRPKEVFMELQVKNTYLSPGYIHKSPGVKSFAIIRGDAGGGIPMKQIIGV
ncbi:MAG: hypothetical protein HUN04_20770 [Desulfobacter sp.]|nr:MAG: hypothetical protein HUN04_20770 [Desulfobacter sp.]